MINTNKQGLVKAAGLIMVLTLLSKIFGFLRETAIAAKFGASAATDAYLVAMIIPLIIVTLSSNALLGVFVPVLSRYFHKNQTEEAWKVVNTVINLVGIIAFSVSTIGSIFSSYLISLVGYGFKPATSQIAVEMSRSIFFTAFFLSMAYLFSGVLNAAKKFAMPAFAPTLSSLLIIAFSMYLKPYFGMMALVYGTVFGALAQMLIQMPSLYRAGYRYKFYIDVNHQGVRDIFRLMVPIMIGAAVAQVNFLVDRITGSTLSEGSISALNFANKLFGLPMGIITLGIGTAVFPAFSSLIVDNKHEELKKTISYGITLASLICFPAMVGLIVLKMPIVKLLFQHGSFDALDTIMTSGALLYYTLGLLLIVWRDVIVKVFFSYQDTSTPVKLGIVCVVLNIVFILVLSRVMAHEGIALATTIANSINTIMLWYYLRKKIGNFVAEGFITSNIKIFVSSLAMGIVAYWSYNLLSMHKLLTSVFVSISLAVLTYIILLRALKVVEFMEFYNKIFTRFSHRFFKREAKDCSIAG